MSFPEEVLAATEEACQHEPLLARTRMALLRLEKEGHRAGWDSEGSGPRVYRMDRDSRRPDGVRLGLSRTLTRGVETSAERIGGDVGEALQMVASAMEHAREGAESLLGIPGQADVVFDGLDLPLEGTGHTFYGYALRYEGWTLADDDADTAEGQEAFLAKRLHEHPRRIDVRMVFAVTRDGLRWMVQRRRQCPPAEAIVMRPEGNYEHAGLVPNALGRIVAAVAGNPVPVPQRGPAGQDLRERVRRLREERGQ